MLYEDATVTLNLFTLQLWMCGLMIVELDFTVVKDRVYWNNAVR
jgi:hypothetical protein